MKFVPNVHGEGMVTILKFSLSIIQKISRTQHRFCAPEFSCILYIPTSYYKNQPLLFIIIIIRYYLLLVCVLFSEENRLFDARCVNWSLIRISSGRRDPRPDPNSQRIPTTAVAAAVAVAAVLIESVVVYDQKINK